MVGQKVKPTIKIKSGLKETVLQVRNLSIKSKNTFGTNLKNINFELHQGEILGIGGVAGSGQAELLSALTGETNLEKNTLLYKNIDIGWMSPRQRREIGLLTAPEERLGHAAAPEMNLIENSLITAKNGHGLVKSGWINLSKAVKYAEDIINKFDVRTDSAKNSAKNLSGGNLQKFLIGRELNQNPEVLIVNQPTWGVDASAAQFIRQALLDLISKGNAVIIISQDLDELLEISDRFTALVNGSISQPQLTHTLSVSEIGLMLSTENRTGLEA